MRPGDGDFPQSATATFFRERLSGKGMLGLLLGTIWFLLPAYAANMTPVFAARLLGNHFAQPLDLGRSWRGHRILGDHKTIRGFVVGISAAILTSIAQHRAVPWFALGSAANPAVLGFLLGSGALLGDAVKSFFKRRRGIEPGASWIPFDQIDLVVGALAMSSLYAPAPLSVIGVALGFTFFAALAAKRVGYLLGVSEAPR